MNILSNCFNFNLRLLAFLKMNHAVIFKEIEPILESLIIMYLTSMILYSLQSILFCSTLTKTHEVDTFVTYILQRRKESSQGLGAFPQSVTSHEDVNQSAEPRGRAKNK